MVLEVISISQLELNFLFIFSSSLSN